MTAFDWHLFMDLAKTLAMAKAGDSSDEARYRTAVGRAYYATFLIARGVAQSKGVVISPSAAAHKEVQEYFGAKADPTSRKVSEALKTLRAKRGECDYRDTPALSANTARLLCGMAEATIKTVDSL